MSKVDSCKICDRRRRRRISNAVVDFGMYGFGLDFSWGQADMNKVNSVDKIESYLQKEMYKDKFNNRNLQTDIQKQRFSSKNLEFSNFTNRI